MEVLTASLVGVLVGAALGAAVVGDALGDVLGEREGLALGGAGFPRRTKPCLSTRQSGPT